MAFRSFQEYLKDAKNIVEKPETETVPDYKGPSNNAPPKDQMDKFAGGSGPKGSAKPYSSGQNAANPNKSEKGFAHEGDKDLKYEPKTDLDHKDAAKGDVLKSWEKTSSVSEWLHKTRKLSNANFIKEMKNENVDYGIIRETIEKCSTSKRNISQLVMEMKRNGLLNKFVKELCLHESAIPSILKGMKNNSLFSKYLNEMFDKKPKKDFDEFDDGEDFTQSKMSDEDESELDMDDMDMGSDEAMGDETDDMDDESDEDMDDMEMDSDEDMDDESDEDMDDMEMNSDEDMGDESDEDMDHDEDESALSSPVGHHAKKALKKMGPPPRPVNDL